MKKFFLMLAACVLTMSASAQIVSSSSRSLVKAKKVKTGYNRLYVSYASKSFSGDAGKNMDSASGIQFGYLNGSSLSQELPLFLEAGINAQYNSYSKNESGLETSTNFLAVNIPFSLAYKWDVPGAEGLSFTPYLGLHLTVNALGTQSVEGNYTYDTGGYGTYTTYVDNETDFFSNDDMGKDNTASRVQIGWQIGVGLSYKALYLGIGYSPEFGEYLKKVNTSTFTATLGLNF